MGVIGLTICTLEWYSKALMSYVMRIDRELQSDGKIVMRVCIFFCRDCSDICACIRVCVHVYLSVCTCLFECVCVFV